MCWPTLIRLFPPASQSAPEMRVPSPDGAMITAPVSALSSALPPVWSGCQCVLRIALSFQPRSLSSASTGAATPGSTTAVLSARLSWTSQM